MLSTHSEVGGWKWMPFGAGSQWPVDASTALGTRPKARVKARLKPSTDSYPAAQAASVTPPPCRSCHAARSSMTRRRIATGASPASRDSTRVRWNGEA